MTNKVVVLFSLAVALILCSPAFAQSTEGAQRVIEPIIINGQQTQGAITIENGSVRSYSCPSPQSYVTVNESESGWACFDQQSGLWLLHALAPSQASTTSQQPVVVYTEPTPTYVPDSGYSSYSYPYGAYYGYPYGFYSYPYGYGYPYAFGIGPTFGLGFGVGFGHGRGFARGPVVVGRHVGPVIRTGPHGGFVGHGFVGHGGFAGHGGFRGPGPGGGGFRGGGGVHMGGGGGHGRR